MFTSIKEFKEKYKKTNENVQDEGQPVQDVQPEGSVQTQPEGEGAQEESPLDTFKSAYHAAYDEYMEDVEDVDSAMEQLSDEQLEFVFNLFENEEVTEGFGNSANSGTKGKASHGFLGFLKGKSKEEDAQQKQANIDTMSKIDRMISDGKTIMFKLASNSDKLRPYDKNEVSKILDKNVGNLKIYDRGGNITVMFHPSKAFNVG